MRIKSIDFLRGIAIILVLFRHFDILKILNQIGWIGVDLFFVISGFLVSGLLFKEYQNTNTINGKKFFIRRAFKIYPLFWLITIYVILIHHYTGFGTPLHQILAEFFFYQNYTEGILAVSWSLAVEEHFYILLIISLHFAIKYKKMLHIKGFNIVVISILLFCLVLRLIINSTCNEFNFFKQYTPTHIRIDSLCFGVLIAYNYYFNKDWLILFVNKNLKPLLTFVIITLSLPFIIKLETSFMATIGFTIIYLAFGTLLCLVLLNEKIKNIFENKINEYVAIFICTIGTYSYAIYLTHTNIVSTYIDRFTRRMLHMHTQNITYFVCYFTFAIIVGALLTNYVEKPFLKIRDKYFPASK